MNPNACKAAGRGLQPKGVRVKEVADFKVFTKGAGSGALNVSVKGPSEFDSSLLTPPFTMLESFPCLGCCQLQAHLNKLQMHRMSSGLVRIHINCIIHPQLEHRSK